MKFQKVLLATGVAVLAFASVAAAYTFSSNLTVGSTGAAVSALQNWLIGAGYSIPAIQSGAANPGYFGAQTQAAVKKYQAANGIPNTGFVGPLTRAALNAGSNVMTSGGTCPAGYTCTATAPVTTVTCPAGYTCTSNSTGTVTGGQTGITTPGVQGIMSVTQGPISVSTAYAGQSKVPILDARIQAQYSDLAVQSLQLDLGSSTSIYNYVYSKVYLIDPSTGNVLTSEPLNSSTVVQNGNNYAVGLSGFNFIVPKGTFKDIQVAVDLYPTILTQYLTTWYTNIDSQGIRSVDGAGVNQYGPLGGTGVNALAGFTTGFGQGMVVQQNLTLNASANVSLDAASPLVSSVPVTNLTTGQYLGLPVLVFDVNSQGDNLHLHNATVNITTSGQGSVTAAYLYQGSTPIMSASVVAGTNGQFTAVFNNIPDGTAGATIPINTTVPFTVKVDVSGLTAANSSQLVQASTTSTLTIYNSADSSVTINGTASGNQQTVLGQGLSFSLSGTPTITKVVASQDQSGNATDTYTATFNVVAQAVGTSVTFGLPGAAQPSFGTTSTGINLAQIYQNGAAISASSLPAGNTVGLDGSIIASYSAPTNTTISSNGLSFTLGINQSVTIPVTYSFSVKNPAANVFGVQIQGISTSAGTSTFMANQTQWRTSSI